MDLQKYKLREKKLMLECIKEEKKGQNWKELCHCIHHWCIWVPSSTLSQRLKKDGVVLEKGQGQGNVYDQKSGIRSMVDLFVYLKKKKKMWGENNEIWEWTGEGK